MRQTQQAFADRSQAFIGGTGPGGDATSTVTRARDLAAYERMVATLPKKPPRRSQPLLVVEEAEQQTARR